VNIRIIAAYVLLLVLGIPWYWPSGHNVFLLGLPLWVLVSLLVGFAASVLTAWLFLHPSAPDRND
jgi:hypothetical protein